MGDNGWSENAVHLLRKWERTCTKRKHYHYKASNKYGWHNKFLSIPIILISTIMGSLSFIHPSFLDKTTCSTRDSRLLTQRNLQSPTPAPTSECMWEKYEGDIIDTSPYCDNSLVKFDNDYYKSSLTSISELECDRDVNFVGDTVYNQFAVAEDITTESEAEAWCVEQDEGHGVFYQKWVDGQIICMILAEPPNNVILHGQHLFGGVCLSTGLLNNPTQTYIYECGDSSAQLDIYNGNCGIIPICALSCPGIIGGYDIQTMGFMDCGCCYDYWTGCSWGECSGLVNSGGDGDGSAPSSPPSSPSPPPSTPSYAPSKTPTYTPSKTPTYTPSKTPTYTPSKTPTYTPSKTPTYTPSKTPTYTPSHTPTRAPTDHPTYATQDESSNSFTYIIGGFNMLIAVLSALHTFLKYDALEDRHNQYSRHFGALKMDIETLLSKPPEQRGDSGTIVENYKTKYAVLINNAPDLPEKSEIVCCTEGTTPINIELT